MEKYFELPHVGDLYLEHTFYELDGEEVLFVCQDEKGNRYLCSCCRLGEKWVIGKVQRAALLSLIDDVITIREVFEKNCDSTFLVGWDGRTFSLTSDFPCSLLPRVGAKLELEKERHGGYRKTIEREVFQRETLQQISQKVSVSLSPMDILNIISHIKADGNILSKMSEYIQQSQDLIFSTMMLVSTFESCHTYAEDSQRHLKYSAKIRDAKNHGGGIPVQSSNHTVKTLLDESGKKQDHFDETDKLSYLAA